jgi:hypothetical protein
MVSARPDDVVRPVLRPAVARTWLLAEALALGTASAVHAGRLIPGFAHAQARTAEAVIALVLVGAAVASWLRPAWTRWFAIRAQGFALVGLFTIAIGIGPQTVPDVAYHLVLLAALAAGLVVAVRCRAG